MGMMTQFAEEANRAEAAGEAIYRRLVERLRAEGVKPGSVICINIETEQYVVAETRMEAVERFRELFGNVLGWFRRVDE